MNNEIKLHSRVKANRDLPKKFINKGDKGTVFATENIDSEIYLHIKMDDGGYASPSSENCWELISNNS